MINFLIPAALLLCGSLTGKQEIAVHTANSYKNYLSDYAYSLHSCMQVPRRVISVTFKLSARMTLISPSHGKQWMATSALVTSAPSNCIMSTELIPLTLYRLVSVKQLRMDPPSHIQAHLKPSLSTTTIIIIMLMAMNSGSISCGFEHIGQD